VSGDATPILSVAVDPQSAQCAIGKAKERSREQGGTIEALLPLRIPLSWYPGFVSYGSLPYVTIEDLVRAVYREGPPPGLRCSVYCMAGDLPTVLGELLRNGDYRRVIIGCASPRRRPRAAAGTLRELAEEYCRAETVFDT
jgi:hypothetical protein